jgi:hypothetical protein
MNKVKQAVLDLLTKGSMSVDGFTTTDLLDLELTLSILRKDSSSYFDGDVYHKKPKKKENVIDYSKFNKPAPKSDADAPTLDYSKISNQKIKQPPKPQTQEMHTTLMNQRKLKPE